MNLIGKIKITSPYNGKSKFPFWNELKIGDEITLSVSLDPPGRGRSLYATNITAIIDGRSFTCSTTQIYNYLTKVGYEVAV
jgi:hypothetical protein